MNEEVYRLLSVLDAPEDDSDGDRYFNIGVFRTLDGAKRAAAANAVEDISPEELLAHPLKTPRWSAMNSNGKPVLYESRPWEESNFIFRIVVDELQD